MERNIPFSAPDITQAEIEAVNEVIRSGWLAHGKYSKRLEELFCEFTGAKYATTVSNCTAGLHLSCLSSGFGSGDEVIVPAQTHTATSHAVEYTGAKAVFADVHPITGNILSEEILKKLTPATRGIIPVHIAGYPCDMGEIKKICDDHNLVLIEDCAHAIGTRYNGKHVGNIGISGCFSFYPTKQISTGEGGVVISNDKSVIDFINKHKAFGIDTPPEMRTRPGVYDVQGVMMKEGGFDINVPAQSLQSCTSNPVSGLTGIFGMGESCVDVDISEYALDSVLSGSVELTWEPNRADLYDATHVTFYIAAPMDVNSADDVEEAYALYEAALGMVEPELR